MSLFFTPYTLQSPRGELVLPNRAVIAPMCQYAAVDGCAGDWHLAHWGQLFNSGAALFTIEATAVLPEGRITPHCLGLWDERTGAALGDTLTRARALAPHMAVCIQLAHAGRKASSAAPWNGGQLLSTEAGGWRPVGPSAVPHLASEPAPEALTQEGLERIREGFVNAARRADAIGIEAIELHAAHGYLLHQFLSPLSNQRQDTYGGSLENRMRFVLEVFGAVRQAFSGVLGLRLSATDWVEGGWDATQSVELALRLRALGANFIHVSSGGLSPLQKIAIGPGYQLALARQIRQASGLPTTAVGLITDAQQAEALLQAGDADLVAMARAFLYQPHWTWQAANVLGGTVAAHPALWRGLPRESAPVFGPLSMGQR